jgi:hypothetical protein
MKGFSITLVFGRYGGFYASVSSISVRLCLGWVAFTIYYRHDIEEFITALQKLANRQRPSVGKETTIIQ